jgi:hypothetical protein
VNAGLVAVLVRLGRLLFVTVVTVVTASASNAVRDTLDEARRIGLVGWRLVGWRLGCVWLLRCGCLVGWRLGCGRL